MNQPTIFISYHHKDSEYLEQLLTHLSILTRTKSANIFYDKAISAGESRSKEIKVNLEKADLILMLISPDYLASDFIYNQEIQLAFDKEAESGTYVIPIILRPTNWISIDWLRKRQVLPQGGNPISSFENKDEAYYQITNSINDVIKGISKSALPVDKPKPVISDKSKTVFVSHDHDDGDFAELLKLKLEKEGFSAWIDNERLRVGQDWREEIDSAITDSMALIAIMSPDARNSEYVTYEWAYAWGSKVQVLPIMLKKTQLHPRLESLQYLDFTNRGSRPWNELFDRLNEM